jgi:hypothetical protein
MRFLVVVVTTVATLAFIAASCAMNWKFMTSLGKSEFEQQIFGSVSVAVSVFIALLPTLILWAWRERRFLYVALGVPVFLAFVAFSLSSAVGFAAKNRGALMEDRSLINARLEGVKREIEVEEAKGKALGAPRLAVIVQEALHGLEQDRKWQRSKGCQEATAEAMRTFCKGYFDLKAEAARAGELTFIEGKIARLKREARGYEEKGGGRQADNQAAVLASFLGFQPVEVERGLTLFLAVLVEIGAALGLYFATGHLGGNDSGPIGPSRGVTVVESRVLKDISQPKTEAAPLKQIAGPASGSRRVPRMKRNQNIKKTEAEE